MTFLKLTLFILLYGISTTASAKLIQIIHTNDLHSFFEGSRNGYGGYSRIKTLVDKLKADAASKGIKTLFLDGGDFGEGGSFYFSNKGVDSFRALDLLGVDVAVLGNHDYILGGNELQRQLKESNLQANFLSANLRGKEILGLGDRVKSFVDYEIEGMKIRIFGLTTSEIHYRYFLLPIGKIDSSHEEGINQAEIAQNDDVDFLIGLTHTGVKKDETLVAHTTSIDMIIGGHSHTRLDQPKLVPNLNGELIPVFQTGAHGTAVGSAIIDVHGKGEFKLIDYRLYDVSKDIAEDVEVKKFVDEAYVNRERYFNRSWTEVIGFSEIPLSGSFGGRQRNPKSCWSEHIARLTRLKADTDLSVQFDIFQGEEIPAGNITFGNIIENFPHFRTWGDKGWNVSRGRVTGTLLFKVIQALIKTKNNKFEATFDGLEFYDESRGKNVRFKLDGTHDPHLAMVNGYPIKRLRTYTLALPSELPYAVGLMSPLLRSILLMKAETVEDSYFWPSLEKYIGENSPLKCLPN